MTTLKKITFSIYLFITACILSCQVRETPLGIADSRFSGTWKLVQRLEVSDSAYYVVDTTYTTYKITTFNPATSKDTTITKDTTILISTRIDTSFVRLRTIPNPALHTLSFSESGELSAVGEETSYFKAYRYYLTDNGSTPERIGFIVGGTFRETSYMPFRFTNDTLYFLPQCSQSCYLAFTK